MPQRELRRASDPTPQNNIPSQFLSQLHQPRAFFTFGYSYWNRIHCGSSPDPFLPIMTDQGSNSNEGEGATFSNFPQDPSEFENDPRVSFSKLDDKYILETEDGQEFEYDSALKRWIPTVCAPAHE